MKSQSPSVVGRLVVGSLLARRPKDHVSWSKILATYKRKNQAQQLIERVKCLTFLVVGNAEGQYIIDYVIATPETTAALIDWLYAVSNTRARRHLTKD